MKTTKLFTILSLLMIFAGTSAVYSDNLPSGKTQMQKMNNIRYEVNVYQFSHIDLCNTYLVQVKDETGRLVAPPKTFVPGIQRYIFTEIGPARGKVRVAMLILSPFIDPVVCQIQIGALPDVKMGSFLPGQTYSFELLLQVNAPFGHKLPVINTSEKAVQ
jgi:hypothetical protein